MSFAACRLREGSPADDCRNDRVVSLEDKIVEVGGSDGAQNGKLFGGIGSGENVQRPVAYRRTPQMRMVGTDPVMGHQQNR